MDVARSEPQGVHYHLKVVLLASYDVNKKGSRGLMAHRVRLNATWLNSNIL